MGRAQPFGIEERRETEESPIESSCPLHILDVKRSFQNPEDTWHVEPHFFWATGADSKCSKWLSLSPPKGMNQTFAPSQIADQETMAGGFYGRDVRLGSVLE